MKAPGALAALRHTDFRLYFVGQGVSVLGTWVQQVAMSWLVYRLTGSAELLGLTAFLALVPQLVVGPLAGAWFDRHDRRRLLMGVQFLLTLHASILALLTGTGAITAPMVIAMALVLGILNGLDTPLRQSIIGNLLDDRTDIRNALSLNATLFNTGRFVGPPIAGLILAATSETVCFSLNAASFMALFATLSVARVRPSTPGPARSYLEALREGFHHAWHDQPIRMLLILVGVMNVTASAYAVLAPLFAKEVFHGDERTLGLLIGAAGCGAMIASVTLTMQADITRLKNLMMATVPAGAVALVVFSVTDHLPTGLAAMTVVGFAISFINVGANGLLQSLAPDHLRGRIASLFTACRFGLDAIGGMIAGLIAGVIHAPNTLLLEGVLLGVGALYFLAVFPRLALEPVE